MAPTVSVDVNPCGTVSHGMPLPLHSARACAVLFLLAALMPQSMRAQEPTPARLRIGISVPATRSPDPVDGRIILVISNNDKREPRFQNNVYDADTQLAFGVDVDGLR